MITYWILCGFSAIYFLQINKNNLFQFYWLFQLQLFNVIFVIAILIFQLQKKNGVMELPLLKTFIFSLLLYLTHLNLIQYLRNWNYKILATCILNLTNTDHTLIDRLGRFFLNRLITLA